jgi:SAM-dependent methyltransferase
MSEVAPDRTTHLEPVDAVLAGKSLVDHARRKLLYNELADKYHLAVSRDTSIEVNALDALIQRYIGPGCSVLDLACGVGRHTGPLAAKGYDVCGIDLSPAMLRVARETHQDCSFTEADVRNFALWRLFDAAYMMWTTFNYLGNEKDIESFLESVGKHLRVGGILILEMSNFQQAGAPREYRRTAEDQQWIVTVEISKRQYRGHNVAEYRYEVVDRRTGSSARFIDQEIARIYTASEVFSLTGGVFEKVAIFGDYDLAEFNELRSPRLIIVLAKQ